MLGFSSASEKRSLHNVSSNVSVRLVSLNRTPRATTLTVLRLQQSPVVSSLSGRALPVHHFPWRRCQRNLSHPYLWRSQGHYDFPLLFVTPASSLCDFFRPHRLFRSVTIALVTDTWPQRAGAAFPIPLKYLPLCLILPCRAETQQRQRTRAAYTGRWRGVGGTMVCCTLLEIDSRLDIRALKGRALALQELP